MTCLNSISGRAQAIEEVEIRPVRVEGRKLQSGPGAAASALEETPLAGRGSSRSTPTSISTEGLWWFVSLPILTGRPAVKPAARLAPTSFF